MDSIGDPYLAKEMVKLLSQELKTVRQQLEAAHLVRGKRCSEFTYNYSFRPQRTRETPSSQMPDSNVERVHIAEAENVDLKVQLAELRVEITRLQTSQVEDDDSRDDKSTLQEKVVSIIFGLRYQSLTSYRSLIKSTSSS